MTQGTADPGARARLAGVPRKRAPLPRAPRCARSARSARRRRSACASPRRGGSHYLMYSFSPGLRILNGDLQAITGLRDLAVLGRSRGRARALPPRRARRARRRRRASTPAPGRCTRRTAASPRSATTSSSGTFLGNLCRRTRRPHLLLGAAALRPLRARAAADPPRPPARACAPSAAPRCASRSPSSRRCACASRARAGVTRGAQTWTSRAAPTPCRGRRRGAGATACGSPRRGPSGPLGVRAETVRVRISEREALRRAARAAARGRAAARRERRAAKRRQASRPGISPLRKESTKRR